MFEWSSLLKLRDKRGLPVFIVLDPFRQDAYFEIKRANGGKVSIKPSLPNEMERLYDDIRLKGLPVKIEFNRTLPDDVVATIREAAETESFKQILIICPVYDHNEFGFTVVGVGKRGIITLYQDPLS